MKKTILETRLANVVREICQNLYNEKGAGAVYDYCNKINLYYSYCGGCEAETPTIETVQGICECAVCGSSKDCG